MSSSGRTGPKGAKGAKADKSHKTDGGKGGGDKVHGANKENHLSSKNDELSMKDKVKQLMELTCRSEDEVCLALHESDHDINMAINLLYEEPSTGEWETKDKKKKKRQTSAGGKTDKKGEEGADDWDDVIPPAPSVGAGDGKDWKERGGGRNNNRNPSRSGGRGWREEGGGGRGSDRRGRGGPGRGGSTRGRGGGRGGRYPPRGGRGGDHSNRQQQPIDTWDSSNTWDNSAATPAPPPVDDWDDLHTDEWSTEEYTGSLVETKVFTPSVQTPNNDSAQQPPPQSGANSSLDPSVNVNVNVNAADTSYSQSLGGQSYQQAPSQPSPVPPMVGSLTAAQTQYFSQLSQQNSDTVAGKQYASAAYQAQPVAFDAKSNVQQTYSNSTQAQSYSSTTAQQPYTQTPTNQSYGAAQPAYAQNSGFAGAYQEPQAQPQPQQRLRTQRARVPPPSKIPASAVEMPGDLNSSNVAYLDVQFGAMDLIDSSFDSNDVARSLENNRSTPTETDAYGNVATSKNGTQQSSISTALSQGLSNSDIPQQPASEHLSYNNARSAAQTVPVSTVQVTDKDSYQSGTYNSYKGNNYTYGTAQTTTSSYVNNPSVTSYNQASYSSGAQNASYSNSYSSTTAQVYQNASYPVTQSNSYQNNPSSQSVYGANTGLSNNSNYSSAQYNSYNKLKDNSYEASVASSSTTSSNATATSGGGKTTVKNPTSVMSNIPPGVTPVMSTPYIMGQMPYFQQHPAAVYSFEDVQLLQQRMPHMTTPYYDMGYQTPTTMATVRGDPTATALGGYGAGAADARFQAAGRAADGAASPVPPASQQQQQQQQTPILTATPAPGTATPYFFAAAPYNTLGAPPNYAQFGTMYTQLPTVTNASNQYGPKPATYGSAAGYGAYDALGQSAQDYSKASYAVGSAAAVAAAAAAAAQQAAQKGQANSTSANSAGTDLSAMYGKTHAALGKVNSYEKQGFHSGTPPPFTGALSQSAGGAAYAQQVYIPTMPQHHSTMAMHQPLHQDSSGGAGQRSQGSSGQAKTGSKQQGYGASYWNQN